jgi:predicted DNA-binding transcriptional regulator AlpA
MRDIEFMTDVDVATMLRCHRGSVDRLARFGKIPKPIKVGGRNLWPARELRDHIERLMAQRECAA